MGYEHLRTPPHELALIKQQARQYAEKPSINPGIDQVGKTFIYHGLKNSSYEERLPVFQKYHGHGVYGPRINARELIEDLVSQGSVPTVLDVGCGKEGTALEELRTLYGNGINLWGFDLERVMSPQTVGSYVPFSGNVVDLAEIIPLDSVDVVFSVGVIPYVHHNFPRIELLANFAQILKQGGFGFVHGFEPFDEFRLNGGNPPYFDDFIMDQFGLVSGNEIGSSFQKVR